MKQADVNPKNDHGVPKRQWKKWTVVGKHVFNKTYSYMMEYPDFFRHPKADTVPTAYFKTTAWNAAWVAADVASRGEKHLLDILTREVKGGD